MQKLDMCLCVDVCVFVYIILVSVERSRLNGLKDCINDFNAPTDIYPNITDRKTNTQGTNEADNYACKQAPS